MKLSLLVMTAGKQEGKTLEIKLPQFLIGRDPQCQLRPASPLISKRHCAIIQKEGKAYIRDFGSTNGTFVNEDPVQGERELLDGDVLKVGPIAFTVRLESTLAPTKTPAPVNKAPVSTAKTPAPPTKPVTAIQTPEKPAPSKSDTPIPATAASKNSEGGDDDIAAMLLSLEDGESSGSTDNPVVPEGSTVFDLKVPPELANDPAAQKPTDNKAASGAKPAPTGDTRSAAARLLEKMTKRPRT